jgi:hypothetical protein
MKNLLGTLSLIIVLGIASVPVSGQQAGQAPAAAPPSQAAPAQPPSPPPDNPPPPPITAQPPAAPAPAPQPAATGQWVYTSQYGWVWMPYGNQYTYTPSDGSMPDMYVYYPVYGWCWLTAPWLWGCGPVPYFGVVGPRFYLWFGVGLGHWYGFGPRYRSWGWSGRGYWGHGGWVGMGNRPGGFGYRGGGGFGYRPRVR